MKQIFIVVDLNTNLVQIVEKEVSSIWNESDTHYTVMGGTNGRTTFSFMASEEIINDIKISTEKCDVKYDAEYTRYSHLFNIIRNFEDIVKGEFKIFY